LAGDSARNDPHCAKATAAKQDEAEKWWLDFAARKLTLTEREAVSFPYRKTNSEHRWKNFRRKNWRRSGLRGGSSISKRNRATGIFSKRLLERAMTPRILSSRGERMRS